MKLRNIFALLLLFVAGLQSIKAQEAYAVLNGGTMTFYYDNQRSSRPGQPSWHFIFHCIYYRVRWLSLGK